MSETIANGDDDSRMRGVLIDCTKCPRLLLMVMMMMMMYLHACTQLVNGLAAAMPTVLQPLCCMPCAQHRACKYIKDSDSDTHTHTHAHHRCAQALEGIGVPPCGHGGFPRVPVGQGHKEP